jgi:N4-gp56 family major capsid protein
MTEKMDLLAFDALGLLSSSSVNPSKIFYRNSSGVVSSTGTPATAKTGGNRAYVPLRPLRVDGEDAYVLLVHPDCLYDLESDSTFLGAQRDAMERSKTYPLFVGAKAYWRGVIIRAHENCAIATNGGGGSVAWAKCAFLGAQALAWSWGERPDVVAETFDYQEQQGYAIRMTCGVKKTAFNSLDFGSLGVYLARTNVSGL